MASVAALPLAAQAQDAGAQANGSGVETVVVTAQKRSEKQVDVPISLVALSGVKLQKSGVQEMKDLSQVTPSLHVDSSGAFFQPSIRGVGTAIAGAGSQSNVATYVDGIYQPNTLSANFDFIDVDSVQVLKGPQGTLFGRNATGGAILITTKQPTFDPQLTANVGYGSFNTFDGNIFGSMGITDTLAVSAAVGYKHSDGWTTNVVTGRDGNPIDDYTARLKVLYQPVQSVKLTLTYTASRTSDPSLYAADSYKGWSDFAAFYGVPVITGSNRHVSLGGNYAHDVSGQGVNLKGEFDLGFATLTSYSSGQWDKGHEATVETASAFPVSGTPPTGYPASPCLAVACITLADANWNYIEQSYSQEFDLANKSGGVVDWVAGLFYFHDRTQYNPFNTDLYGPFGPGGLTSGGAFPWPASSFVFSGNQATLDFAGISESYAAFGDATINFGKIDPTLEKLHLTLGGRLSQDHAGVEFSVYPLSTYAIISGIPFGVPELTNHHDWNSFTPRAVLRYSLSDDSNLYASWSTGTKSGLFNTSGYLGDQKAVKPEAIVDIEGGYKVAKDGWQLEASAFHYEYRDLQVATYAGAVAVFQNALRAEIYGGDVHWVQRFTDWLNTDIGVSYTHARYTNFTNAALQTFSPVFGVVNSTANVSGGVMERTPSWTGSIGLDLHHDLMGGLAELNMNYSFQTASSFDFENQITQGTYGLVNARAAWTDPSGHWTISAQGRNMTNVKYLVQVLPNAGGFGATYGEPASYMGYVTFTY